MLGSLYSYQKVLDPKPQTLNPKSQGILLKKRDLGITTLRGSLRAKASRSRELLVSYQKLLLEFPRVLRGRRSSAENLTWRIMGS